MQYEEIVDEMPASAVWMINYDTDESREGVTAFHEQRNPDFDRWEK